MKRPKPHPRAYVVQPLNEHEVQIIEARRLLRGWLRKMKEIGIRGGTMGRSTESFFKEFPTEAPR